MHFRQLPSDDSHRHLRLRQRYAWLQSTDGIHKVGIAVVEQISSGHDLPLHHAGDPSIRHDRQRSSELGSSDTNHGEGVTVERQRFPHQARVGAELALPKEVAQHHDGLGAGNLVFLGQKRPAQDTPAAEHIEIISRNQERKNRFLSAGRALVRLIWLCPLDSTERDRGLNIGSEAGEDAVEVTILGVFGIREMIADAWMIQRIPINAHQAVGLMDRQRPECQRVEQGENGCVHSYAQS